MQKYCLVTLLEPLKEGDEFVATNYWPLHITLASNFIVDWEKTGLFDSLSMLLSHTTPVTTVAVHDELFGGEKRIPVTLLDMTPWASSIAYSNYTNSHFSWGNIR